MGNLRSFLSKLNTIEFIKYTLASAFALIIDYGCYWTLAVNDILSLPKAAVVGYAVGLVAAYFLIAKKVFQNGWLSRRQLAEAILFFVSGLLGMTLTYITVLFITFLFGSRENLAKLSAVVISFFGVYLFRKLVVFKNN